MTIKDQVITDQYAIYNGDCMEVMRGLPEASIHLSIYSPPFGGLYHYSSDERDLSNCDNYEQFFEHYAFVVREMARITMPGRMSCVHAMDVPRSNTGTDSYLDFPGDIIRLHQREGWQYAGRHMIWKEPLEVRLRTMQKNLAHATLCVDSLDCGVASGDYLLLFRRHGENPVPVAHPVGLLDYAGERAIPSDVLSYRGWTGKQTENRYSHWIWRQYADCMWDDIRFHRVLPFQDCREDDDEKHVHPLQLDVIDRCVVLRSNPGETVFTPFMGVGSEVYSPICLGRRGVGAELKASYFRQDIALPVRADATPRQIDDKFKRHGWRLDPHVCPGCISQAAKDKSMASQKPSAAAMRAQAQMIQMLAEHFDTTAGAYAADWSDKAIAEKTGLAVDVVVEYRRAAFGEIKEPAELAKLRQDIAALETLQREHAAALSGEIAQIRARLAKVSAGFAA